MIEVSSCPIKRKECSSCYATGEILTIEHGNENHTASFFLCLDCSEELRDKLTLMGDLGSATEKLLRIEWEINNSDMSTAVENIINIVNE